MLSSGAVRGEILDSLTYHLLFFVLSSLCFHPLLPSTFTSRLSLLLLLLRCYPCVSRVRDVQMCNKINYRDASAVDNSRQHPRTFITAHSWRWFDNSLMKVYQFLPSKGLVPAPPPITGAEDKATVWGPPEYLSLGFFPQHLPAYTRHRSSFDPLFIPLYSTLI